MAADILADSSIWIDHINQGDDDLAALLKRRRILLHPMIIGEIALGSIANRSTIIEELGELPQGRVVAHAEVMAMVEWQNRPLDAGRFLANVANHRRVC